MLARPASPHAQIIFVSGVSLAIGLKSTVQFFTKPKNRKGSIAFRVVLFLVLIGWPVFGMMADSFGFALLFSRFWPTAAVYLQKKSTIGWIFQHPYVTYVRSYLRLCCC
ncbi:vesicle transport protein GOT1 isoform X4 [Triticum aestivum]|uniref:vesicle transport protein GOT1 isoform X4 n=1 Tax=Triticum aestivum TaxID=4565 RepID=UPI001D0076BF|nr:vesicle transport protein GOT1-like isoform X4 [Triticum aestivum]